MRPRIAGVLLVAVIVVAGGFALGPHRSLLLLAVPTTFAMPIIAAIAEWRAGVGGARAVSAVINALIILVLALAMTLIATAVAGHAEVTGLFSMHAGQLTTFPYVVPLGALTYVTFLQVSVVSEARDRLPERLGRSAAGVAVVACFAFACGVYLLALNWHAVPGSERRTIGLRATGGPLPALDVTAWLIAVTAWQAAYNLLGGWPLSNLRGTKLRLLTANVTIAALGTATYVIDRKVLDVSAVDLEAAAALFAAGSSVMAGLLGGWPLAGAGPAVRRAWSFLGAIALAALGDLALRSLVLAIDHTWTRSAPVQLWLVVCGLNLIGGGVLIASRIAGLGPAGDQASDVNPTHQRWLEQEAERAPSSQDVGQDRVERCTPPTLAGGSELRLPG